ncbi:hypothetical protein [Pseudomonas chlororaphis]|uniref:hypothetical protein n=1 Tax=Pseudomonas chlororaphis TaxID=587753 RepID=UPI000B2FAAB1|nr:hypothetical protein [Pseudomonas chlororaphis]
MQMHETQQVKEVYSPQEANQLLKQGWILLTVVAVTNPKVQNPVITVPCYIFGQTASAP